MSESTPPPPPPPPGQGGYGAPPPAPGYGAAAGAEHPRSQTLLILSIVGLLCCGPLAIYTLITSNTVIREGAQQGLNTSKANTAKIISIIALVLWAVGIVVNIAIGGLAGLSSSGS